MEGRKLRGKNERKIPLLRRPAGRACWERGSCRTTFSSRMASDYSAMRPPAAVPIPYGNRTRVFDMKSRCPNHWTKGTKKKFLIYLPQKSEVVRFVSIRNFTLAFVFMLAIDDVHSTGPPPTNPLPPLTPRLLPSQKSRGGRGAPRPVAKFRPDKVRKKVH